MKPRLSGRRLANWVLGTGFLICASPLLAPQLLAFPYKADSAIGTVWSERPILPTDGGWRVAAEQERNGGSVDALFERND